MSPVKVLHHTGTSPSFKIWILIAAVASLAAFTVQASDNGLEPKSFKPIGNRYVEEFENQIITLHEYFEGPLLTFDMKLSNPLGPNADPSEIDKMV